MCIVYSASSIDSPLFYASKVKTFLWEDGTPQQRDILPPLEAAITMTVVTTCNNAVYEAAKVDGSAVLLESFRPEYLSHAFEIESNLQENTNQTPEIRAKRLLDKLKASVAAVERSNCLHSTMDRTLFEELVRSDNGYITRGVDNEKGRKVLFLRTGRLCKGTLLFQNL